MLPSRYRLRSRSEISRTIRHGRRARRGSLVVHVHVGRGGEVPARAAFAVSRAVGDSVTRHRVVRRLRGITPALLDRLPGGSELVVRAMPEAATATTGQLREDLENALERITPLSPPGTPPHSVPSAHHDDGSAATLQTDTAQSVEAAPRTGWGRILWWVGWPVRSLLLGLVWVYRHTISPMLPPTCRYHPSCSAYGFEALRVHGAAKGAVLAAWRVLRCNPWSLGGLDPVPARGSWQPDIHPDGTPRTTAPPRA